MKPTLESQRDEAKNLLDILLILKERIFENLHVASLAYVDKIISPFNGVYGLVSCRPFPLEEGQDPYSIQAYYFSSSGDNLVENQIIIVLFTDRNFISNLDSIDKQSKPTTDNQKHLIKYGVVITSDGSGQDGRGIVSIEKTSSVGLVDTYTITYTDGTTSTFEVTNGKDGEGSHDVEIRDHTIFI